jgi:V8-like Glu-specific endopeptidase
MKLKRPLIGLFTLTVAFSLIAVTALAGPGDLTSRSKAMEPSVEPFDRDGWVMEMDTLNRRLLAEHVAAGLTRPLEARVDPGVIEGIVGGREKEMKIRIGAEADVSFDVGFSDLDLTRLPGRTLLRDLGAMRGTADGGFVWSASVMSPEAAAIRVHIEEMSFAAGSELYVWTRDGMAFGPYTGRGPNGNGEFWTSAVQGEEVILQIHHRGGEAPSFRIAGVSHITSRWPMAATINPMVDQPPCSFNADCVIDADCAGGTMNAAVNTARGAVAEMVFASGAFLYLCSGGLVADADTSSSIPYFITANHCISKAGEASSLETYFLFDSDNTCGNCPKLGSPSTNGSSIAASNRTSDYTLLQLSQAAPGGTAFLGWNANEIAFTNNTPLYRISHPGGAPQSYSEHTVDTSKPTCSSWPRGNWIYSRDTRGATEGGSSGSPVVNAAGELVGQLSGACGFNVNDNCDADSNATVDGAFAAYYDQVAQFLGTGDPGGSDPEICDDGIDNDGDGLTDCEDPDCSSEPACDIGGGCTDADGDGWCVEEGDCDDNDFHVRPGHPDKGGRWGRDGKDNDCNGVIDG